MNTSTQNKPRVLGIVGATASAKTALSLPLAQVLNCEIVCMDSMQIYRRMDIGTAKPTADERALIPHHMLDIVEPTEPFSVAQYVEQARAVITDIVHRGRVPMLVGGTGLYLQGLTLPMDYGGLPSDPAIRKRLTEQAEREGAASMHACLAAVDPPAAARLHPNDQRRVIRALELYEATGRKMSAERISARAAEPPYRSLCLCLTCRDRAALYDRIGRRVDLMVKNGVLDEAKQVYDHRESYRTAAQAIGYKEFFPYFEGTAPLEECTEKLKQATRNYAKRQLTWFRRNPDVHWLRMTGTEDFSEVLSAARQNIPFSAL